MSIHKMIVVHDNGGRYIEGNLDSSSAPKPGQVVSLKSSGEYELWNGAADGEQDEIVIVVEDDLLGKTINTAYAVSSRFKGYIPGRGSEVQVLVASGQTVALAGKLIVDDATGKMLATTGSPELEPFKALEGSGGALGADTLLLCRVIF